MTWRSYLQSRTRQPEFLWRMVSGILAAGIVVGLYVQETWVSDETNLESLESQLQSLLACLKSEKLAEQREWWQLWWSLPAAIYQRFYESGPLGLSILAGCCWFTFLWHALKAPGLSDLRLWCALLAVALGVLSIWPTDFLILWQKYAWNLQESDKLVPGIHFYVLGVGLREELAKLLCVLPLMPILLRMRDELSALLISSCVGLGFAVTENINYFESSEGTSAIGRFLTANPMHMTLTGLAGLMLYRALRNPRYWALYAVWTFGVVIYAHGLYDAFIVLPDLEGYFFFNIMIFALVVHQFFRELGAIRLFHSDTISLSANFFCGVSLLMATTFVYLSATLGVTVAFDTLASGVFCLAIMAYLFLQQMQKTMVGV